jgi:hypothetical protein
MLFVERTGTPSSTSRAVVRSHRSEDAGCPHVRGEVTVAPFVELSQLIAGKTSAEDWRTRWAERGFADRKLAQAGKSAS